MKRLRFAFTSCQYPADIFYDHIATQSYRRLAEHAQQGDIDFVLFLGDQIYTDRTAGIADFDSVTERYTQPSQLYLNTLRALLPEDFPVYTSIDDHEIIENWEPISKNNPHPDLAIHHQRLHDGVTNFLEYLASSDASITSTLNPNQLYFSFHQSHATFFVADSRTQRGKIAQSQPGEARTATNIETLHIMSREQRRAIRQWLTHSPPGQPKFLTTPSIFLPRRSHTAQHEYVAAALRSDTWDGFPNSLLSLLAFIADNRIENLYFLSGDEHMGCLAQITITSISSQTTTECYSIHTPALHAPFPFANSKPDDLACDDQFFFKRDAFNNLRYCEPRDADYLCVVSAIVPSTNDGFSIITVTTPASHDESTNVGVKCSFIEGKCATQRTLNETDNKSQKSHKNIVQNVSPIKAACDLHTTFEQHFEL